MPSFHRLKLVLTALVLIPVFSASAASSGDDRLPGSSFFAVAEDNMAGFTLAPERLLAPVLAQLRETGAINVLRWSRFGNPAPQPLEKYVRDLHFGPWMDPANEPSCFNIRALVLARDSRRPITTVAGQPCFVATGLWYDPYTNRTFTDSRQVQIDHVVALKNAYISGGHRWDWKTRCAYANFMGNRFHLIAVDGPTNMQKGDMAPHGFMPPNFAYRCEYLASWLRIKLIWGLWISEPEAAAIQNAIRTQRCDPRLFNFPKNELARQRQAIAEARAICPAGPPPLRRPPPSVQ